MRLGQRLPYSNQQRVWVGHPALADASVTSRKTDAHAGAHQDPLGETPAPCGRVDDVIHQELLRVRAEWRSRQIAALRRETLREGGEEINDGHTVGMRSCGRLPRRSASRRDPEGTRDR